MAVTGVWERIYRNKEWGRYPEIELVRFISRNFYNVKDRSKVRILDLGCGTGANAWFIAREGFTLDGIDGSSTAIAAAKRRFAADKLKGKFVVGDFTQLPYPDATFDAVCEIEALYCNRREDIVRAIAEIRRVLKPGGKVFSQIFGRKTTGHSVCREIEPHTFTDAKTGPFKGLGVFHFVSLQELPSLFRGFTLEIDVMNRTGKNRTELIQEFIVKGTKTRQ